MKTHLEAEKYSHCQWNIFNHGNRQEMADLNGHGARAFFDFVDRNGV